MTSVFREDPRLKPSSYRIPSEGVPCEVESLLFGMAWNGWADRNQLPQSFLDDLICSFGVVAAREQWWGASRHPKRSCEGLNLSELLGWAIVRAKQEDLECWDFAQPWIYVHVDEGKVVLIQASLPTEFLTKKARAEIHRQLCFRGILKHSTYLEYKRSGGMPLPVQESEAGDFLEKSRRKKGSCE